MATPECVAVASALFRRRVRNFVRSPNGRNRPADANQFSPAQVLKDSLGYLQNLDSETSASPPFARMEVCPSQPQPLAEADSGGAAALPRGSHFRRPIAPALFFSGQRGPHAHNLDQRTDSDRCPWRTVESNQ